MTDEQINAAIAEACGWTGSCPACSDPACSWDARPNDELIFDATERIMKLEKALERIRDCDWVITLPDRMDAVRAIAREALE